MRSNLKPLVLVRLISPCNFNGYGRLPEGSASEKGLQAFTSNFLNCAILQPFPIIFAFLFEQFQGFLSRHVRSTIKGGFK